MTGALPIESPDWCGTIARRIATPAWTAVVIAVLAAAQPVSARTPTRTDGPSPTATETATSTPTGTAPPYVPHVVIAPNPARSGQRVTLDASDSFLTSPHWSQSSGDVALTIEQPDALLASFVAPAVEAPRAVQVRLASPSLPELGYHDYGITILPANLIAVQVGSGNGPPGGLTEIEVRLEPYGLAVSEFRHRIAFDAAAAIADRGDGVPDCDLGPGLDSGGFTFLPTGCQATQSCTTLVADLGAQFHPIMAPSVVYRCRVAFTDQPAVSCRHALRCAGGDATDVDGTPLVLSCGDGSVLSRFEPADPVVTLHAEPAEPLLGDTVRLTFSVSGDGGIPGYQLLGTGPFLTGELVKHASTFGDVTFELEAECPGAATLQLGIHYETTGGCPGNSFFYFRDATSQGFPLRIRDPNGVNLAGRIGALPDFCGVAMAGVTVSLDPLGRSTVTAADGSFNFDPVPPGDYTLTVTPLCNTAGCWDVPAIHVGGDDVAVELCPHGREGLCPGDCNEDDRVSIDELILGVRLALGDTEAGCAAVDFNLSGDVEVSELVTAVNAALVGCPPFGVTPSATMVLAPTRTPTPPVP